jgi:TolB-like protein/DNA-binding winged helix-turn-helix (wHTH) protein
MDQPTHSPFTLGEWSVDPILGTITRGGDAIRLEPRTMRLLVCLAERAGEVVSADDLLDRVWPNVIVTPDSVYQAVAALRRLLGDDPKNPRYVVTVPKQGYRMVAPITAIAQSPETQPTPVAAAPAPIEASSATPSRGLLSASWKSYAIIALVLALGVVAIIALRRPHEPSLSPQQATAKPDAKSVVVMPFLDLTEAMGEEVFADGMTEELIDKLAKIPDLRVPPPTASFWFKDKQMTIAEIANKLDVAYVLDGSVRKSGAMLRVAARLVRASDGFVIWSESYDRPADDKLMIQDDIAGEVGKALETAIGPRPTPGNATSK